MAYQNGEQVKVSGEVKWGDTYYRVATMGIVEQWKKGAYALIILDEIDGDRNVCVHVKKADIYKEEE